MKISFKTVSCFGSQSISNILPVITEVIKNLGGKRESSFFIYHFKLQQKVIYSYVVP